MLLIPWTLQKLCFLRNSNVYINLVLVLVCLIYVRASVGVTGVIWRIYWSKDSSAEGSSYLLEKGTQ